MLTLFPDEQIVSQSDGGIVTLTTHRICYEYKDWGRAYNQSIMLEHITSCENHFISNVMLIILALLCIIGGFISNSNGTSNGLTGGLFLAALALGVIYWRTRKNVIVIASPSTKMKINVAGMKRDKVLGFINTVEQTKNKRIVALNTR